MGFNKAIFEKQMCVTKSPFLDKKPNPEIPVIIFAYSFLFQQQKTLNLAEAPIFVVF